MQRAFAKYLAFKMNVAYPTRDTDNQILIAGLTMTNLSYRRVTGVCNFLYELVNDFIE